MSKPLPTQPEKELEDAIRQARDPLLVLLSEPYHPGARAVAERLRALLPDHPSLRLIEIHRSACRDWAARHGVDGTPCLLLFAGGRRQMRLPGVHDQKTLDHVISTMLASPA